MPYAFVFVLFYWAAFLEPESTVLIFTSWWLLLELLCLCAVIFFVALIRRQVSHLSSLILRLFVPPLCVRVTVLIHLKDKHTPESNRCTHSLTQTYPFLIISWCSLHGFLHFLTRRCWDCCRHFWRICIVWTGTSPLLTGLLIHVVYLPFIWVSQISLGRGSTIVSCPTILCDKLPTWMAVLVSLVDIGSLCFSYFDHAKPLNVRYFAHTCF